MQKKTNKKSTTGSEIEHVKQKSYSGSAYDFSTDSSYDVTSHSAFTSVPMTDVNP